MLRIKIEGDDFDSLMGDIENDQSFSQKCLRTIFSIMYKEDLVGNNEDYKKDVDEKIERINLKLISIGDLEKKANAVIEKHERRLLIMQGENENIRDQILSILK